MKKTILLILAVLAAQLGNAQTGVAAHAPTAHELEAFQSSSILFQFETPIADDGDGQAIRAIDEINHKDYTDAYPWLSADGLKIYITKNLGDGTKDKLFVAQRNSTNELFNAPQPLNVNSYFEENDILSCWLTNDELHIYFTIRKSNDQYNTVLSLYHAERTTIHEDFEAPVLVQLNGEVSGFLSSPSLTQDQSQLYVYNDGNNGKQISIFQQNGDNNYDLVDAIHAPEGFKIGSGQLSKDGLSFTLSLKTATEVQLYQTKRTTISDDFSGFEKLNNGANAADFRCLHPSFSADESIMAFVRSNANDWSKNELYIGHFAPKTKKSDIVAITTNVQLFPNPATTHITISNAEQTFQHVQIFSMDGKLVLDELLSEDSNQHDLNVSTLHAGVYVCKVSDGSTWTESLKFVVK